jgi:adenylosuccinate synthase
VPVIGNGVVIDLAVLIKELDGLIEKGVDVSKLKISANAHIITPYHVTIDKVSERFLGKRAIGTTGRGIGPTYGDKVGRLGIRVQDLFDESILRQKVEAALSQKNQLLSTIAGGATIGSGIGPTKIDSVIGILKAYTTRVGAGPFPTELFDQWGEFLREKGFEFGTTTGRERRCGWFDAPVAKFATRINGLTDIFLTKLDVLTGIKEIPVCVAYDVDGVRMEEIPVSQSDFHHAKPIYEIYPGWDEDITGAKKFEDLPKNAQDYVLALEKLSGTRISAIGVGPDRNATIVRHDLLRS